jgi:choline dehydrogenase
LDTFDYIVIGAGSAGCVLADRLSKDGRNSVLVIEAGGHDRRFWIRTPIGYGRIFHDARINWKFEAEADPGTLDRIAYWPRGKVVGGSSSINALVYCRGLPHDFDDWRRMGNAGWGWDDVEPVFRRFENRSGSLRHGQLSIADIGAEVHPLKQHFLEAAGAIGLPLSQDFNGPSPEGVGTYAITRANGRRCSAADAFLRQALQRSNLRLETKAQATRILFEGLRARGIVYRQNGVDRAADARVAVIVSAGAVKSPQLLQVSGIGPGALLRRHGIEVLVERPAVGGFLQDHLAVTYAYRASKPTLNDELASLLGKLKAGLRYLATRRGPLSLSVNQCGGFVRADPSSPVPDVQLYFNPLTYVTSLESRRRLMNPDPFPGFILSYQPARPTSRGRIDIASADPLAPPAIRPNSLSTDKDLADVVAGGRLLQRLVKTQALQALIAKPLSPSIEAMDDAAILADFRARCGTVYHPVGTCRMGPDPSEAVVDPQLRVHGVEGLRVVDASAFPCITSGNTNAPTIMLAQKAADIMLRT